MKNRKVICDRHGCQLAPGSIGLCRDHYAEDLQRRIAEHGPWTKIQKSCAVRKCYRPHMPGGDLCRTCYKAQAA